MGKDKAAFFVFQSLMIERKQAREWAKKLWQENAELEGRLAAARAQINELQFDLAHALKAQYEIGQFGRVLGPDEHPPRFSMHDEVNNG